MRAVAILAVVALTFQLAEPPLELPASASAQLARSLAAAQPLKRSVWRDTVPVNGDGTVNGYIEIARGDRRKWELDIGKNVRAIDRVMPADIGGYPVNYGFVPQTISYDGDPFDILVLGPPIAGGRAVRAVIVGLMHMEDEKGLDSKVVASPPGPDGKAALALTEADRARIGDFFNRYKRHEPGKFSRVPGWGSAAEGLAYVKTTHRFYLECRDAASTACRLR
jgi:inorganic pyrophosphatase